MVRERSVDVVFISSRLAVDRVHKPKLLGFDRQLLLGLVDEALSDQRLYVCVNLLEFDVDCLIHLERTVEGHQLDVARTIRVPQLFFVLLEVLQDFPFSVDVFEIILLRLLKELSVDLKQNDYAS